MRRRERDNGREGGREGGEACKAGGNEREMARWRSVGCAKRPVTRLHGGMNDIVLIVSWRHETGHEDTSGGEGRRRRGRG